MRFQNPTLAIKPTNKTVMTLNKADVKSITTRVFLLKDLIFKKNSVHHELVNVIANIAQTYPMPIDLPKNKAKTI